MDYTSRLNVFQQALAGKADLAFFPISADLQYLTGVPREMPTFGAVLHPGAWVEGAWISPNHPPVLTLPRMTAEFGGLADIQGIDLRILGDFDDPAALVRNIVQGFHLPARPRVAISDRAYGHSTTGIQSVLPDATFLSATDLLRPQRTTKTADEIAVMQKAGEITEAAFAATLGNLRLGMTELDIMAEVDYQIRKHGGAGPSFTTSMYNSGPNYPLIFGDAEHKWHRPLHPPVSLLFDFGAIYGGYCYDFGRTVAFGEPDPAFRRVYELVMAAQRAGIEALQADVATCEQADQAARAVIQNAGYGSEFRHRLGHAIGLDVHEPPFLTQGDTTPLREGMLFTVEPSITQFNSYSARVEDVVLVTKQGGRPLTTGFQDLIVIV